VRRYSGLRPNIVARIEQALGECGAEILVRAAPTTAPFEFTGQRDADDQNIRPMDAYRALPKCRQNSGEIRGIAVDSRELRERGKALGFKLLEPEVTRHQLVRDGCS
jgi:hypothetical protein